jgi:zinc transporter, ZIP family
LGAALGWGALAASSLVLGVLLAFARRWPPAPIGLVLAFGAGALISAVSFELAEEGTRVGSAGSVGIGLALGALSYYGADGLLDRSRDPAPGRRGQPSHDDSGEALALGSFLDGVPEQLVLGVGLAGGQAVSVALLVAIFVSNLPEGVGAAADMGASGTPRAKVIRLFLAVGFVCTLATGLGYAIADAISGELQAAVNGFAAGALLVMLIDSMIPEARHKAGRRAGLATVIGFAVASALSNV